MPDRCFDDARARSANVRARRRALYLLRRLRRGVPPRRARRDAELRDVDLRAVRPHRSGEGRARRRADVEAVGRYSARRPQLAAAAGDPAARSATLGCVARPRGGESAAERAASARVAAGTEAAAARAQETAEALELGLALEPL